MPIAGRLCAKRGVPVGALLLSSSSAFSRYSLSLLVVAPCLRRGQRSTRLTTALTGVVERRPVSATSVHQAFSRAEWVAKNAGNTRPAADEATTTPSLLLLLYRRLRSADLESPRGFGATAHGARARVGGLFGGR